MSARALTNGGGEVEIQDLLSVDTASTQPFMTVVHSPNVLASVMPRDSVGLRQS